MATPRKHWFKVADSIAYEDLRNDELAFLIRLMATLNTRWARDGLSAEDACEISLSESALMALADVRRPDAALGILARLQSKLSIETEIVGTGSPGVYFLHSKARGMMKIGKTTSLWQRFDSLRRETPDVELAGWIDTMDHGRVERELHSEFADARREGEWFDTTPELISRARSAQSALPPRVSQSRAGRLIVVIRWEKWSEFQGLTPRDVPESRPLRKTPPQDARRKTQERDTEAPPAPTAPRSLRVSGKRPCPEFLDEEAVDRIREWGSANGIEDHRLPAAWECFRDWAHSNDKRQANWEAGFRNALRRGWVLERRNANETGEAESAAQAKVRRSKEAAARVIQMLDRKTNGGLIA